MAAYEIKEANAVGLDAEAATLLAVVAAACEIPKQKLASAIITEVLIERVQAGLYGEED